MHSQLLVRKYEKCGRPSFYKRALFRGGREMRVSVVGLVWFVHFYTLHSILMVLTVPIVPSVLQTLVIDSPPY
jgi:hypothetical protein